MTNSLHILQRFNQARSRKRSWERTYEEALAYAAPQRETFGHTVRGTRRDGFGQVYDSTAIVAYQKFASNLQMSLVPPYKRWINLVPGRLIAQHQRRQLKKALEDVGEAMFTYLHMSNFDTQIAEAFADLGLGTGALLVQKGEAGQPLRFTAVPLAQLYLEEGANGTVGAVYRQHKVAARNILPTWDDATLPAEMQRLVTEKPDQEWELVEATIPTDSGFSYTVIEPQSKAVLVERKQTSSPWVVFRYSVMPGEVYGRGPLLTALPDIKTLNKTKELILKNASLAVAGAYTVADDGVVNVQTLKIQPGALIPVASNGGGVSGPTIAPLPRAGEFNIAEIVLSDLRQAVNDMLFADPLGPIDLPAKTATEVAMRQQELAKRIGSAFGRLQHELIGPLVNRVLHVLDAQGLVDLSAFRVDGGVIAIEHVSPLAMAQDQAELVNLLRYGETMVNLFGPQLGVLLTRPDAFAERVAKLLGVPSDLVPTAEDLATLRQMAERLVGTATAEVADASNPA